ncbi:InlB B-repeat-containing protein [Paenibacillus barcinonensis]|uniref:InlB B-repeat-containing protein n=1 Tax=Paenibacillus barcinonensis TaxID=198119 RepID=UPI001C0FBAC1|nr:InlB B-repeat-containing protein [Paenibacillus barcinonensis]
MIQHACRAFWKITLVFVLTFTTCSLGNGATRLAHAAANQPYVGEIQLFPYNYAPEGWTFAAGQTLSIASNSTLYSLLGTSYGGDGRDNFSLPNLTSLPVPDGMGYYISTGGLFPSREEGMVSNALAGEVRMFPYAFVPGGWLKLDGSKYRSMDYPRLYDAIGSMFGSSDGNTFTLPSVGVPIPDTRLFYAVAATTSAEQNGNDIGNGTGNELMGESIPFLVPMQTTWLPGDGRLVSTSNQALFSLLGVKFGGNGTGQFGLPNLSNNPYTFRYYVVLEAGIYPRTGNGGGVPGGLAGTSTIYTVPSGQSLQIYSSDLLGNASGSGASGVSLRTQPQHGTVSDRGNGFTYTAASNYSGDDSFTVRTYNNNGFASGYSTIRIKVEAPVPPAVSGVSDGGIYNGTVTPGFTNGNATLNGSEYLNGTPIGSEGSYTLVVTNNYGTTTVSFTIDLTPPTVDGVSNGARYTVPPTITFSDGTAKLNGEAFDSGDQVSREGSYTLIVTDKANNSSTLTFSYYLPRQLLFDSGGGTSVNKQEVYYGDYGIEPTAPTRTGYTFTGWYSDADLQQPFNFTTSSIYDDVQLYAGWERNQYTVSFDTTGGSPISDQSIGYGDQLTLPIEPTSNTEGQIFAGWFADSQFTVPFDFSQPIQSNVTLYAKWAARVQQITFDTDGGSIIAPQTAAYGDHLSRPADPERTGYTFAGWYTDATHAQPFDFATATVNADMTLYAKWNVAVRTVTFDTNGATTLQPVEVNNGEMLSRPSEPVRSGYTFTGWYTDRALTQPFDFATATVNADITLYAGWKPVTTPGGGSNSGNNGNGGTGSSGNGGNSEGGGGSNSNSSSNSSGNAPDPTGTTQVSVSISAGQAGVLRLGTGVLLEVPAGASDQPLEIKAIVVDTPVTGLTNNERVVSQVIEFNKNTQGNFKIPVKLTLNFDPTLVRNNEQLVISYQQAPNTAWIRVEDGKVDGNKISVDVNHFTRFAVMAIPAAVSAPAAVDFSDIEGHWASSSIREAATLGIVKGYVDGTFHPEAHVTRAEFTAMLVRMLKPSSEVSDSGGNMDFTMPSFTDMAQVGGWVRDDIAKARELGWIKGDADGSFRPNASITRAEMAVMISRVMTSTASTDDVSFADAVTIPVWAREAAAQMQQSGLMKGRVNGDFDPTALTTRAEAAQVLIRAHHQ